MELAERVRAVLAIDPDADAIEHDGTWHTWGELGEIADAVDVALDACGCGVDTRVGMLLRNHHAMVGAMLGVVGGHRCIVTVNPHQGDAKLADELRVLRLPVLVALESELDRPGLRAVLEELDLTTVGVRGGRADPASLVPGLDGVCRLGEDARRPGIAVEMLTSGTTGPPKRIPLAYEAFERTINAAGEHYRREGSGAGDEPAAPRLRTGVAIVNAPFVHMSGIFRTLLNVCEGRRVVLLDRFTVDAWLAVVRAHRPRAVSLVPTALRMVLDADVDPDDLASIEVVTSGSAALDPRVQAAFEERYGIAVLPSYGATEFAGGVAGWTLPLHREWADRKLGSVGRPQPGRALRVVDPETGNELPPDAVGLLEVGSISGGEWVRTTDLARIDADGFLWIAGRTDDAILRGGFKVFPGEIAAALRSHPAVRECGVTGVADERLGAVPVAAVELVEGATVTGEELMAFARERLTSYQMPRDIRVVGELPRTPSLKVSAPGVAALFESPGPAGA